MSDLLSAFANRLLQAIRSDGIDAAFPELALELFRIQGSTNDAYRRFALASGVAEASAIHHWRDIPAVPTVAFKELALTSLSSGQRTRVFHSSGTTAHQPSRHFHGTESLALYEAVVEAGFEWGFWRGAEAGAGGGDAGRGWLPVSLTPEPSRVPHSSLVHMVASLGRRFGLEPTHYAGRVGEEGWELDLERVGGLLDRSVAAGLPVVLFGTAFNFVHLVEGWEQAGRRLRLVAGSRVMETGGYKGRSREWAKPELRAAISRCLGVPERAIVGEYGMSELSSQAYEIPVPPAAGGDALAGGPVRGFAFPPWARAVVMAPETGREAPAGEPGLLRVLDLANVWSVMAVQTEDRAVSRGGVVELLGRAPTAEPRGCSLMAA